jgi:hypothetical protein
MSLVSVYVQVLVSWLFHLKTKVICVETFCSMLYVVDSVPTDEILLHVTDVRKAKEV